jgi:hypothetical protein
VYPFSDSKRHTIYDTGSDLGGIEIGIPGANNWYMEDDALIIDLNFGNSSRVIPVFKCDGNGVELTQENEPEGNVLFRECHTYAGCTE